MRVEFRNFSVGNGKVWVHDGSQVAGPYSGNGIFGDGHFWSATIFSELVTIEYEPEAGAASGGAPPFEIRTIAHRATTVLQDRLVASPDAGKSDPAAYCHLDPNCYPDWRPAMSTVAQLAFEDEGVSYFCSGSLVATRDNSFKPYLLTAGHCIHSEAAARTLESFWTYQTASCGAAPPVSRQSSAKSSVGGHLIGSGSLEEGDYSLVLLQDVPAGVTFAGWDMSDPPVGSSLVGIHHPQGSWKRISFGERVGDSGAIISSDVLLPNLYLQVMWDQGRTEPGSSGSPLFSSPGVIVGTLTYGPSSPTQNACQISPSVDGYGRFSNTYQRLRDYFEDLPAATVVPAQPGVQFTVANRTAPAPQMVQLTTQSAAAQFKLRADASWILLSADSGDLSQTSPAQVSISVDPSKFDQPDRYAGTVTIFSGAAPPQFINVVADVRNDRSNVTISVNPNPVHQSGGGWNFTVAVSESAGVNTHLVGAKLNGIDYSSLLLNWFGNTHLAGGGTLSAPLQTSGVFAHGDQYLEIWGVDDATGRPWYQVTTVNFQ